MKSVRFQHVDKSLTWDSFINASATSSIPTHLRLQKHHPKRDTRRRHRQHIKVTHAQTHSRSQNAAVAVAVNEHNIHTSPAPPSLFRRAFFPCDFTQLFPQIISRKLPRVRPVARTSSLMVCMSISRTTREPSRLKIKWTKTTSRWNSTRYCTVV